MTRALTLRQKLLTLVMIVLVPLTAVIAYDLVRLLADLRAEAFAQTEESAESAATAYSRLAHQLAEQAQAAGLAILEGDLGAEESRAYLLSLGQHVAADDYAVIARDGTVIADTGGGLDALVDTPAFRSAALGEALTLVSLPGRTSSEPTRIAVLTPVRLGGRVAAVSAVSLGVQAFGDAAPALRPGETLLLTDAKGRLLFRAGAVTGLEPGDDLSALAPVRAAILGDRGFEASVRLPRSDAAFTGVQLPVPDAGLTAGVYVPAGRAVQQVFREGSVYAVVIIAVVIAAAIASRAYGLGVLRVVGRLSEAAHRVAEGDFGTEIPVESGDELGALAEDFRVMQGSLERAFEDASVLEEAARRLNEALDVPAVARVGLDYAARLLRAEAAVMTVFGESVTGERQVFGYGTAEPEPLIAEARSKIHDSELLDHRFRLALLTPPGPGRPVATVLVAFALSREDALLGRVDVITSPREIDRPVFERTDVELAAAFMAQTAAALANAALYERERFIAESLQDSLLTPPPPVTHVRLGLEYRPATVGARIGGDFYDFIQVDVERLAVVVGDISGKGLAAASHTMAGKGAIRSFALDDPDPSLVLQRANAVIAEELPSSAFITAVYALVDEPSGLVIYAVAGHPPPFVMRRDGMIAELEVGQAPLGVVPDQVFTEGSVQLGPGDRLVLYTDGLTEARAADGRFFGEDGVLRTLETHRDADPQALAAALATAAEEFTGGRLIDDLAVVIVEYVPTA